MKRVSGKKGVGVAVHSFSFSLEGGAIGTTIYNASRPWFGVFISFYRVIRVHTLVGEVDNGLFRVREAMDDRPSATRGIPSLPSCGTMLRRPRRRGFHWCGLWSCDLVVASFGDPEGDFLLGGVAMR
jgi:hypothetical protein